MKLPSIIKGWLNTDNRYVNQPEKLLADYLATNSSRSLDALVAYYHHDLYHYVLSLSDSMLADDIIQTTWLKVMNSAANYQPNTSLKSWLFSIARNTLIDELRRNNRWQWEEIGDVIESTLVSPEILCVQQEQLTMFNAAIEHLPFYQREAFIFQQEGFSMNEICHLTNDSFETVKSRVRYAKKNIKKQLELANENR